MVQRKLYYFSWHSILDQANDAAVSTRLMLSSLVKRGWKVQAICGPVVDDVGCNSIPEYVAKLGLKILNTSDKGTIFSACAIPYAGIETLAFCPKEKGRVPSTRTGEEFVRLFRTAIARLKPDIVLSDSEGWFAPQMPAQTKACGIKSAVLLNSLAYADPVRYRNADLIITPSEYAAEHYRRELGLETVVIPPMIHQNLAQIPKENFLPDEEKCVLFATPSFYKGAYFFAGIINEMSKIRPDIRFLVNENGASHRNLVHVGVDWRKMGHVRMMTLSPDPRGLYYRAKLTIVPTLSREPFCRVAAESMEAGVPVIVSDRGALPDTVGDAGVVLPIPERFDAATIQLPTAEKVAPWLEAIQKLWDGPAYRGWLRDKGRERARRLWDAEKLADRYEAAFNKLIGDKKDEEEC